VSALPPLARGCRCRRSPDVGLLPLVKRIRPDAAVQNSIPDTRAEPDRGIMGSHRPTTVRLFDPDEADRI
jgi:hypothetical protein